MTWHPPQPVLVAEDELVAQKVARRCLEAMGYAVTLVSDGATAVDTWSQQEFSLVLMDLQMDQMDGLQAVREIRRRERLRPTRRVPIFGLSASGAREELTHCTAAGMDGLLLKPLQRARLHQALIEFGLAPPGPADTATPGNAGSVTTDPVNLATLRAKFGDDSAFVRRLCQTFLSSVRPLLSELGRAAEADERALVKTLAHRIKGAGTNVHADRIATLAARIESESATLAPPELGQAIDDLGRAFDEIATCIRSEFQ